MSTFTATPSSAALTVKPRQRIARFGDGYEQRVTDGINAAPRTWSLSFTQPRSEAEAILAFFDAQGAASFDWTPPHGAPGKFVARDWSSALIGPFAMQISVSFEEVFA